MSLSHDASWVCLYAPVLWQVCSWFSGKTEQNSSSLQVRKTEDKPSNICCNNRFFSILTHKKVSIGFFSGLLTFHGFSGSVLNVSFCQLSSSITTYWPSHLCLLSCTIGWTIGSVLFFVWRVSGGELEGCINDKGWYSFLANQRIQVKRKNWTCQKLFFVKAPQKF